MKGISDLTRQDALRIINDAQVIRHGGHFVHLNGCHSRSWILKNLLYTLPVVVDDLCKMFAVALRGELIEVVASSTSGGVSLSQLTALAFYRNNSKYVQAVFAEAEDTRFIFKRGYDQIINNKRVLIVKDTINTGNTIIRLKEEIESCGGEVAGICTLCNWSGGKVTAETFGVPYLLSLLDLDIELYEEDDCPICRELGIGSVNQDLGEGKSFLIRKGLQALVP